MSFAYNYTTVQQNSARLAGVWSPKSRARRRFINCANKPRRPRSITALYLDGEKIAHAFNSFLIHYAGANASSAAAPISLFFFFAPQVK